MSHQSFRQGPCNSTVLICQQCLLVCGYTWLYSVSPPTKSQAHICTAVHSAEMSAGFLRHSCSPRKAATLTQAPTDHSGLQVHKHCSGHMLASSGFTEECVEGVVPATDGFVAWHLTVRLNTMFKAVQFPAGIAYLDTCLPHVDRETLTLESRTET